MRRRSESSRAKTDFSPRYIWASVNKAGEGTKQSYCATIIGRVVPGICRSSNLKPARRSSPSQLVRLYDVGVNGSLDSLD